MCRDAMQCLHYPLDANNPKQYGSLKNMGLGKFWPDPRIRKPLWWVSKSRFWVRIFLLMVSVLNFETWVSQSFKVMNLPFYTPHTPSPPISTNQSSYQIIWSHRVHTIKIHFYELYWQNNFGEWWNVACKNATETVLWIKKISSFKGMEHKFHEITYYEKIVRVICVHISYHVISAQTSRGWVSCC